MSMYEPTFTGAKYTGYRRAAEIARDIRADIKIALANGDLALRDGLTISVTCESYSMGQSIHVEIRGATDVDVYEDKIIYESWGERTMRVAQPWAKELAAKIETLRTAYNQDRSEPMTDYSHVTYHGGTHYESDFLRGERERRNRRAAAARKAAKAPA